jgi:hypothetical protein
MIQKHILFILSAYFGLSLYFSFVIAPILFNVLDKDIAGKIVSKIFPSYFWIGLIIFIIVLIYFIINSFGLITNCIIITAIVLIILQIFYILPASQILKTTNYDGFLKLHFWSIYAM